MRIKCAEKAKSQNDGYVPHKLRARPFRCIALPILCLALFIFYWFVFCPPIYYMVHLKHSRHWTDLWPYYFWLVALLVFILLLALLVCLWRCKGKERTNEEIKARQKEFDCLLTEAIEYNTLKNTKRKYSLNDEEDFDCVTASKETIDDQNFSVINVQDLKMGASQSIACEIPLEETQTTQPKDSPSLIKDMDMLFPRCSVKRKVEIKKRRPDTLILNSPTMKEESTRRHTMKDDDMHSPLTPREIFFFDLMQSANKRDSNTTLEFIENERKHSSNNFIEGARKPEVKDFILKKRPDSGASSPEYFIANVTTPNSCTAEAFLFVDGGGAETKFKITKVEDEKIVDKK